jgi:hypothetical protein
MRFRFSTSAAIGCGILWAAVWSTPAPRAQGSGQFMGSADDPAIAYSTAPLNNIVDDLNRKLQVGSAVLKFDGRGGYLQSVIDALKLPTDSQLLVFSQLSLQGRRIGSSNPRALFFNDRVALGWVRDGELIEVAAHDAKQGIIFYTLEQRATARPEFKREFRCLGCHMNGDTSNVPGLLMFSVTPETRDQQGKIVPIDQRSPLAGRWGGWFVTGAGAVRHLGNEVPALEGRSRDLSSVAGLFEPDGYRTLSSDVAALLTFSHQTQMTNLLTRASWEARVADPVNHPEAPAEAGRARLVEAMLSGIAGEVVDYMLFIDEAALPVAIGERSRFAERMAASGPRDRQGRSLYELDLKTRLMKYPCSYLIYSPAFDALPALMKTLIYKRLWQILSGAAREPRYRALSLAARRAVVEILKDTKPDLPQYFVPFSH